MMSKTEMIDSYAILNSMQVGEFHIAFAEDKNANTGERYLCCYIETTQIFQRYTDCVVSDDYLEILQIYCHRINKAVDDVTNRLNRIKEQTKTDSVIETSLCHKITWADCIENKIIVVDPEKLAPEYQHAVYQLYLCTGGFGAQSRARGRVCYCTSLYDGENIELLREEVLGYIDTVDLPEWAISKYNELI